MFARFPAIAIFLLASGCGAEQMSESAAASKCAEHARWATEDSKHFSQERARLMEESAQRSFERCVAKHTKSIRKHHEEARRKASQSGVGDLLSFSSYSAEIKSDDNILVKRAFVRHEVSNCRSFYYQSHIEAENTFLVTCVDDYNLPADMYVVSGEKLSVTSWR